MRLLISILCIALFAGPIEAAESDAAALARWEEINQQAMDAYRRGDYVRGLPLAREAHAYAERELGPEHPKTLTSLNNLALLYQGQGRYGEAEPLFQKSLQLSEKVLGPEHPNTLGSLNYLAFLYQAQGRYGEAEPLSRKALQLTEKVLGPEHPDTLRSLNILALLYQAQGRYGEAEPLFQKALQLSEKVFGAEHPNTLATLNNLAMLYYHQARYGEAEPLFQKALQLSEKALGTEHPNTLTGLNNLATLYKTQGRYGEAEPLYQKALQLREKVLGAEHPNTLTSLANLALLYHLQDRYGDAEPLSQKALQLREKRLGPEHPDTLTSLHNLAALYEAQGRYGEAEPLCQKALQLREKVLGAEHPGTLMSLKNLAALYAAQGRYGDAEPLSQRALQLSEKVLGAEHPDTLGSLNNLAILYAAQGRYGEAEPLHQKALRLFEKVLGAEHPATLLTELNLIVLRMNQDRTAEALAELQRMEPRLLRRAAALWYTTEEARVRGGLLFSLANFQDVVLSLAIQHPSAEAAGVAAEVVLRWKQLQADEEAYLAALVRRSPDPRVRELAEALARLRARLPVLYRTSEPTTDTVKALEQKELALARLSSPFATELRVQSAGLAEVRSALLQGQALLELRQHRPADFKAGRLGEARIAGVLIRAAGAPVVADLGPVSQAIAHWSALEAAGGREDVERTAGVLYRSLVSPFEEALQEIERLYLAPDGALHLIPYARLKLADGRYWIERNDLRILQTGRDLTREPLPARSDTLLALGGVDFAEETSTSGNVMTADAELRSATFRTRDALGAFEPLKASGDEVERIADLYRLTRRARAEVWTRGEAREGGSSPWRRPRGSCTSRPTASTSTPARGATTRSWTRGSRSPGPTRGYSVKPTQSARTGFSIAWRPWDSISKGPS